MLEIIEKMCNRCQYVKVIQAFHKKKSTKDGYNENCKACRKIIFQEFCERHKTNLKDYTRNGNWKNR